MKSLQRVVKSTLFLFSSILALHSLTGCGGTAAQRLIQEGASPAYAQGFDDGCSSGKKAAGDIFSQFHKNVSEYQHNSDYHMGWNDGHEECHNEGISSIQQQQLAIEHERAFNEHKRDEQMQYQDMVRNAVPDLNQEEIDTLNKLGSQP